MRQRFKIGIGLLCICFLLIGANTLYAGTVEDHPQTHVEILKDKVVATYTAQIGVKETLGKNDSPEIREYLKVTNFNTPQPWCAALVAYCFTVNDVPNPKSAWSPAWFPQHKLVNLKVKQPDRADVFGVYYNNMGRIAHVGFVDRWPRDGDYFITVEGNTNDNGSREGDGVYKKRRLKRTAYKVSRWIV